MSFPLLLIWGHCQKWHPEHQIKEGAYRDLKTWASLGLDHDIVTKTVIFPTVLVESKTSIGGGEKSTSITLLHTLIHKWTHRNFYLFCKAQLFFYSSVTSDPQSMKSYPDFVINNPRGWHCPLCAKYFKKVTIPVQVYWKRPSLVKLL